MRLIDVDKISFRCAYEGDCIASDEKCENCLYYVCDYKEIQKQTTAYNVDNVVAELEKEKEIHTQHYNISLYKDFPEVKTRYEQVMRIIDKAIEIVRKGGVE